MQKSCENHVNIYVFIFSRSRNENNHPGQAGSRDEMHEQDVASQAAERTQLDEDGLPIVDLKHQSD
jgi:hypothetical protein